MRETATIDFLTEEYTLSTAAAVDIVEAVQAWTKYERLPQATKDSLQAICRIFNVTLIFNHVGKKLVLTGICKPFLRSTYLYTRQTLKNNGKLQGTKEYILNPGGEL